MSEEGEESLNMEHLSGSVGPYPDDAAPDQQWPATVLAEGGRSVVIRPEGNAGGALLTVWGDDGQPIELRLNRGRAAMFADQLDRLIRAM